MTEREKRAHDLFRSGYNCAQSVLITSCDLTGMDEKTSAKVASSFGGGIGRLREVCGAVSGMCMAAGLIYGYSDKEAREEKIEHYSRIQDMCGEFSKENGSIICRELLKGLKEANIPAREPEERTEQYYKKRPCAMLCAHCAGILERYIENNPIK